MKHQQGIPYGECPVSFLAEALVLHFIPVQPSTLFTIKQLNLQVGKQPRFFRFLINPFI